MSLLKAIKQKAKKIKIALFIFIIFFECLVILFFAAPLVLRTPVVFALIKSDSMVPVLKERNIVIISGHYNSAEDLKSEIIAFYDPTKGKIIIHRVIDIDKGRIITKGDNNDQVDLFSPTKDHILGKVIFKLL
ncbi:signal peptidase I [Candidatus Parcubacteria bacterium]|nr:signal peptidase I [Candidatus Parcubacteria bacterium]